MRHDTRQFFVVQDSEKALGRRNRRMLRVAARRKGIGRGVRNHVHLRLRQSGWTGEYANADDHAGAEHEFWKAWLFRELRGKGIHVEAEYTLMNGHRVDLVVRRDAASICAIEVETGKSDIATNLAMLRDVAVLHVIVVGLSKDVVRSAQNLAQMFEAAAVQVVAAPESQEELASFVERLLM